MQTADISNQRHFQKWRPIIKIMRYKLLKEQAFLAGYYAILFSMFVRHVGFDSFEYALGDLLGFISFFALVVFALASTFRQVFIYRQHVHNMILPNYLPQLFRVQLGLLSLYLLPICYFTFEYITTFLTGYVSMLFFTLALVRVCLNQPERIVYLFMGFLIVGLVLSSSFMYELKFDDVDIFTKTDALFLHHHEHIKQFTIFASLICICLCVLLVLNINAQLGKRSEHSPDLISDFSKNLRLFITFRLWKNKRANQRRRFASLLDSLHRFYNYHTIFFARERKAVHLLFDSHNIGVAIQSAVVPFAMIIGLMQISSSVSSSFFNIFDFWILMQFTVALVFLVPSLPKLKKRCAFLWHLTPFASRRRFMMAMFVAFALFYMSIFGFIVGLNSLAILLLAPTSQSQLSLFTILANWSFNLLLFVGVSVLICLYVRQVIWRAATAASFVAVMFSLYITDLWQFGADTISPIKQIAILLLVSIACYWICFKKWLITDIEWR